jgi:hypothetical protein
MDGRNRTLISMPNGLRYLVERYQNDRGLTSLNATLIELLETHPGIAYALEKVYAEGTPSPGKEPSP